MRGKILFIFAFALLVVMCLSLTHAAETNVTPSVCCEKTKSGLFCQDVPSNECDPNSKQVPSACSSTSYCKPGFCYDSQEGTCPDNTPQMVCNANNGTWSETKPLACELGCCVLGDQAAFVPLVRCKKLSSFLGIATNFKKDIKNEVQCVLSVQAQDKGACVYDFEFERTCTFTSRESCQTGNETGKKGEFFAGKLCTAEELQTNCAPTKNTICAPGKDGVYFVDSCGNPANIYDASKLNDKEYWANVKDVSEACNPGKDNSNNPSCGNCNYLQGSVCRPSAVAGKKATYGDNICQNLNCANTQNGQSYKHGESWCVYNDEGDTGVGLNSVGSRFYKHICINGQEVLEQCADFRQEECISDNIKTPVGSFSQAACRVNRWQDCVAQKEQIDCENTDRRDCLWRPGSGIAINSNGTKVPGVCLPLNPPGLKFWEGEEAQTICAQANAQCIVTYEKGLFGGEKCTGNCQCLDKSWEQQHAEICMNLGDCGPNVNWIGAEGYKPGFKITIGKVKKK